jgi:hypothetical protein
MTATAEAGHTLDVPMLNPAGVLSSWHKKRFHFCIGICGLPDTRRTRRCEHQIAQKPCGDFGDGSTVL